MMTGDQYRESLNDGRETFFEGEQIRDLRMKGVEVSAEKRVPMLAYLGDSSPEGLDDCPEMYESRVLISEMTFVAPHHRKEKIHKTTFWEAVQCSGR